MCSFSKSIAKVEKVFEKESYWERMSLLFIRCFYLSLFVLISINKTVYVCSNDKLLIIKSKLNFLVMIIYCKCD